MVLGTLYLFQASSAFYTCFEEAIVLGTLRISQIL